MTEEELEALNNELRKKIEEVKSKSGGSLTPEVYFATFTSLLLLGILAELSEVKNLLLRRG